MPLPAEFPYPNKRAPRDHLAAAVLGLVADLLYYDRKEDEDLPLSAIDEMVESDAVTVDEIVDLFRRELEARLRR